MHHSLVQNWVFEAVVALDWDDNGPYSWGSCEGPDLWEDTNERFFGLQNFKLHLGCQQTETVSDIQIYFSDSINSKT